MLDGTKLVGIVTRANLVQAIATLPQENLPPLQNGALRDKILKHLESQTWLNRAQLNVTVENSKINLWGLVSTEAERKAARIAVEEIASGNVIVNNIALEPIPTWV